jgi:hypothetical protein
VYILSTRKLNKLFFLWLDNLSTVESTQIHKLAKNKVLQYKIQFLFARYDGASLLPRARLSGRRETDRLPGSGAGGRYPHEQYTERLTIEIIPAQGHDAFRNQRDDPCLFRSGTAARRVQPVEFTSTRKPLRESRGWYQQNSLSFTTRFMVYYRK